MFFVYLWILHDFDPSLRDPHRFLERRSCCGSPVPGGVRGAKVGTRELFEHKKLFFFMGFNEVKNWFSGI